MAASAWQNGQMNMRITTYNPTRTLKQSLVAIPLLICALAMPALGQISGIGKAMKPEFFTRDLIIFIEGLDLDETQQIIVEALFDDYEQSFEEGIDRMEVRIEDIQDDIEELKDNPQEVLRLVIGPIEVWMKERDVLGDQLIENVRVILVPAQETLWIEFTRKLYIEQYLSDGVMSGESVNIFHVLRDMSLDQSTADHIKPTVDGYAIELHESLRTRTRLMQGPHATLLETINAADTPADQSRKLDIINARIAIRDINDRGIDEIAHALPENKGIEFWNQAMQRGYPRIFRRTAAQRVLESAAAITSYPEDIQVAIDQLLAEYYVELDDYNTRLLDKQRRFDPERLRESIRNRQRKRDGEDTIRPEDPTRELIAQRKAMGTRYIDRLRELLSPEEFDKLEGARRYAPPPASLTPKEAEQLQLNFNRNINSTPAGKGNDPRTNPNAPGGKKPPAKGDRGRDGDRDRD